MQKQSNWFEVDKEGLKELQAGKPKHYLLRELIQNAWDEKVKIVKVNLKLNKGVAEINVEDDSEEGFKDLRDGYTLYKVTSKRTNPEQRGRFNIGEKQAFSICEKAIITTTKGTIVFDKIGRTNTSKKREIGSLITCWLKMRKGEFDEMVEFIHLYIIPENIDFYVNDEKLKHFKPFKVFKTNLLTEISDNNVMKRVSRTTEVKLYEKTTKSYLYEIGIPVCEINCEYNINIQQKIPLSVDRETIPQSYLRDVFSEVLNNVYNEVSEEDSSQQWIREGMSDERVNKEVVDTILTKRYGEKVCVADPFDTQSIDEAIANGYRLIRGNEKRKDEWSNIRKIESLQSSSVLYGSHFTYAKTLDPNEEQLVIAEYAKKLANKLLNININVNFVSERDMVAAQYGNNLLTFNIAKLGKEFFKKKLETTGLILHEIAHHKGNHTEHIYHETLTQMAQDLLLIALREPNFFS